MWYALAALGGAVLMLIILGLCNAADSKPDEARQEAYNKGWTRGHAEGISLGGASENRRARMWRSLALDRIRKAKVLDESARILGEALKRAARERDDTRVALVLCSEMRRSVESIEHGEDWTGGEPCLATCNSLGKIKAASDAATTALRAIKEREHVCTGEPPHA